MSTARCSARWTAGKPTSRLRKFEPADNAGYSGEKDFEQAVIPMQPGRQTVPALAFSFFNPDTRRYETKLTSPVERGGVHLYRWKRCHGHCRSFERKLDSGQ